MFPSTLYAGAAAAGLRGHLMALGLAACALGGDLAYAQAGGYVPAPADVTKIFHGSDDSVLSLRQVGNQVYGFSQHPTQERAYVFHGQVSGTQIVGDFVTLPRNGSTASGSMTLSWSQNGAQLTRVSGGFGPQTWISKLPSQFVFPKGGEAHYQATSASDMDGAYSGSDGSRIWMRQPVSSSTVYWYVERFADAGDTRPVYASVGIGTRNAQGSISGQFWDLPHQTGPLLSGNVVGAVVGGSRDFAIHNLPVPAGPASRPASYKADYAVDLDRFEQEIRDRATPFAIGFSYAIAQDGNVVRAGAGGSRRVPVVGGNSDTLPFTTGTLGEVASTSKTVTAVAVLKALRDKGISVDSPVSPYLPSSWPRGEAMTTVTFRQLLSHGYDGYKPGEGKRLARGASDCDVDFYGCLRDAVGAGMTLPRDYENIHYTLMRYVLALIHNPNLDNLDLILADKAAVNTAMSAEFRNRIRSLLSSVGVDADYQYVLGNGENAAYRYVWADPMNNEIAPTGSETHYLSAGSGGLKMKPSEFAKFLSRLERGDILGAADMATLRDISYGGTAPFPSGSGIGSLWTKNGGADGTASQLMVYPGTEVFYNQNTTSRPGQPKLSDMLRDAWKAALK